MYRIKIGLTFLLHFLCQARDFGQKVEYGFSHVTLQGDLGICHAALGDMDKAFNYLNEAYEKHIATIFYPLRYPHYKLLNEDERYWQLLEKMGLKKYYEKDRNRDT